MSTQTHQRSDICGMRDRNLENLDRSFNSCQSKVKKLHPSMDSPRIGTITKAKSTTRMQNTVNVFFTSSVWCESTVSKTKFLKATNCIWPRLVPPLPKPTKAAMIRAKSKVPQKIVTRCSAGGERSFKLCSSISLLTGKSQQRYAAKYPQKWAPPCSVKRSKKNENTKTMSYILWDQIRKSKKNRNRPINPNIYTTWLVLPGSI